MQAGAHRGPDSRGPLGRQWVRLTGSAVLGALLLPVLVLSAPAGGAASSIEGAVVAPPVVDGPQGRSNVAGVTWNIAAAGAPPLECELVRDGAPQGWQSCAPRYAVTVGADGSWQLRARSVDLDGVRSEVATSAVYVLDRAGPDSPTVTGPVGPAQDRRPVFDLAGVEDRTPGEPATDQTLTCEVLRDGLTVVDAQRCTSPHPVALPTDAPDGAYVLAVRATDAAGNVGLSGSSAPYLLDTTAPVAPMVTGPSGPAVARAVSWDWPVESGDTSRCRLQRTGVSAPAPEVECRPGARVVLDGDGAWQLRVMVVDEAGNRGTPGASVPYVLDTTAPSAPRVTITPGAGATRSPLLTADVEPGETTACRTLPGAGLPPALPAPAFTACDLPADVELGPNAPPGTYVLEVQAMDAAGNVGPVGRVSYLLDDVPPPAPRLSLVEPADRRSGRQSPLVVRVAVGPDETATCRLVGPDAPSPIAQCRGLVSYDLAARPDGTYLLQVVATDGSGNVSDAELAYVLDRVAPADPQLTTEPGRFTSATSWTWAWIAEPGTAASCTLTGPQGEVVRPAAACTSGLQVAAGSLPEGEYALRLTLTDEAGNATTVDRAFVLDRRVPTLAVTAPDPADGLTGVWRISSDSPAATLRCLLERPDGTRVPVTPCGASVGLPAERSPTADGRYVLEVTAESRSGVRAVRASTYVLDTVAPALRTTVGSSPSRDRGPAWTTSASESGAQLVSCSVLGPVTPLVPVAAGARQQACGWTGGLVTSVDGSPLEPGPDGRYLLLLQVRDAGGLMSPDPSARAPTASWIRDTVTLPVSSPLPSPGSSTTPTWEFVGTEPGADLACSLTAPDGTRTEVVCDPTGYRAVLTSEGSWVLSVTQTDLAGNTSRLAPLVYVLDTTAPTLSLLSRTGPGLDRLRETGWTFGSDDPDAVLRCSLTLRPAGAAPEPVVGPACVSPYVLGADELDRDGTYELEVVAKDATGATSRPQTGRFVLDTVGPPAPEPVTAPRGLGSESEVTWIFEPVEAGGSRDCQLLPADGPPGAREPCDAGYGRDLDVDGVGPGDYRLLVWTSDAAGNQTGPTQSPNYRYDRAAESGVVWRTAPGAPDSRASGQLPPGPQPGWTSRLTAFEFEVTPGAAVACSLRRGPDLGRLEDQPAQGGEGAPCPVRYGRGTVVVADPVDGAYELTVTTRLADQPVQSAVRSVTLDRGRPSAPLLVSGQATGGDAAHAWVWAAAPAGVSTVCRLSREGGSAGGLQECLAGRLTVPDLGEGTWRLAIVHVDRAGNASPPTVASYRYDRGRLSAPALTLAPANTGRLGEHAALTWRFPVPAGAIASCQLTRDGQRVRSDRLCPDGRYDLPLGGRSPGRYELVVTFRSPTAGSSSSSSAYLLQPAGAAPTQPGPSGGPAPGPPGEPTDRGADVPDRMEPVGLPPPGDPGGTGGPAPDAVTPPPPGPADTPPDPAARPLDPGRLPRVPGLPGPLLDIVVPAITGVVSRPALPLALIAVVVVFLLVQNRIDRRDPKLTAVPVPGGEVELDFGPVYRPPRGTAT